MSRNFEADVDTQREYYNAAYFNKSGSNQIAKYEATLLKPFFNDPDKWKLAINRFRVPLSAIPLNANNIPFEQWQVGIGFNSSTITRNAFDFVPQYNQKFQSIPKSYNINQSQIQRVDDSLSIVLQFGNIINGSNIKPAYDFLFGGVVYVVNSNLTQVDVYDIKSLTVIVSLQAPANRVITSITSEPATGKFFMAYADGAGENVYIQQYEHTAYATFTTSNIYATNTLRPGSIYSMTFYSSKIYAIYQPIDGGTSPVAYLSVYDEGVNLPLVNNNWNYENSYITHNAVNNIIFVSVIAANPIGQRILAYNPSAGPSYITNVGNFPGSTNGFTLSSINPFVGYDSNQNLIINTSNGTQIRGYSLPSTLPLVSTINFPNGSNTIFQTPPSQSPVESGLYDIFTYQDFLNKINEAFLASFETLKQQLGASFLPTQAPSVIFDSATKLFSVVLEGQYLTLNDDGSKQYSIFMNNALYQKFFFPSVSYNSQYYSLLLQNYGINAIQGTGSATLPQFFYVQQETSTIYAFNDLTRIILGTISIPVSGDGEGTFFTNTGTSTNKSINMITDIIPDTSDQTNFDPVIYIPQGILRWYNLYAQQPFTKIDLIFYYETKDGIIKELPIPTGEYFSCKLEFKKGAGDF